jgi:hypothetical protein
MDHHPAGGPCQDWTNLQASTIKDESDLKFNFTVPSPAIGVSAAVAAEEEADFYLSKPTLLFILRHLGCLVFQSCISRSSRWLVASLSCSLSLSLSHALHLSRVRVIVNVCWCRFPPPDTKRAFATNQTSRGNRQQNKKTVRKAAVIRNA